MPLNVIITGPMKTVSGSYDGKPYTRYTQEAGLDVGGRWPVPCTVRLNDPSEALELDATYELRPSAFVSNENNQFSLRITRPNIGEKVMKGKTP
jgi:hypothetical protein